jgi:hypothetical protein
MLEQNLRRCQPRVIGATRVAGPARTGRGDARGEDTRARLDLSDSAGTSSSPEGRVALWSYAVKSGFGPLLLLYRNVLP